MQNCKRVFHMVLLCIVLTILVTVGCKSYPPHYEEDKDYTVLPEELKDCKIFNISNGWGILTVVRCPNSSTSTIYSEGKTIKKVVVIDGVEYAPVIK